MALVAEADTEPAIGESIRAAAALVADGNVEAALGLLAPALADSSALPPRFVLAMAAWRLDRLDWATQLLRECHETAPMDGTVAEALASAHAQNGNLIDCLYMAKLATALGGRGVLGPLMPPDFPAFEWALVNIRERPLLLRAKQSLGAGNLDDAVEKARQHVALNPADGEGAAFYAGTLLRAGQAGAAVDAMARPEATAEAEQNAAAASLYARGLSVLGEAAAARTWHDRAEMLAPDDAAIAALRAADSVWFESDPAGVRCNGAAWVARFCASPRPPARPSPEGKLVIAYLVSALADPHDAASVAAVARAHDRGQARVLGYGSGAESWLENAAFAGTFDQWRDIAALDPATLARFFRRDGVHVVVDACGFQAPNNLIALARLDTAIRVGWLGQGPAAGLPLYDVTLGPADAGDSGSWWRVGGGFPVCRPSRLNRRQANGSIQFGADVHLGQLDAETVAAWSSVLRALPDARLLLRSAETGSAVVDRLIACFGRDLAARIDLVAAERIDAFYALVDIALAPRRGVSPRMAAEAVGCGVLPIALAGPQAIEPYTRFLQGLGLGSVLVAETADAYVALAQALARSPEARARVAAMTDAVGGDPAALARTLEERSSEALHRGAAP